MRERTNRTSVTSRREKVPLKVLENVKRLATLDILNPRSQEGSNEIFSSKFKQHKLLQNGRLHIYRDLRVKVGIFPSHIFNPRALINTLPKIEAIFQLGKKGFQPSTMFKSYGCKIWDDIQVLLEGLTTSTEAELPTLHNEGTSDSPHSNVDMTIICMNSWKI
ncbi:hypothetical protein M9H77_16744 [Catharanthus roseus]|uniref:Uncharacterized protein n=1 Tax=Catharanthus roseus TaxID=4058 RepID=A0ACC0B2P1_CATRO|nr:hypothetical protein M9H77_16744 [Catharanthus roseus]